MLKPGAPARPGVPGGAARRSRPTAARWSRTARCCRSRRSTSRRTAGSTCTSRCCPPGAAPPRCSTRSGPATRSPGRPRSGSSRSSTPARRSGVMTETIRPDDTAGDLLGAARRGRCRAAGGHPRRHRGRLARGPRRSRPTGVSLRPEDHRRGRPGRLDASRRPRSTAGSARARPRPAPGRRTTASGSSSARSRRPTAPLPPGELVVGKNAVVVGTGTVAAAARRRSGRRASGRCRPPTGRAGCGSSRRRGAGAYVAPPGPGRPTTRRDLPSLPEVELGTSWGDRPTYLVRQKPKPRGSCSTARRGTTPSTPRPARSTTTCS